MEQKEKEEKVDAQKSTEKKMKFYKVLSLVLGILLCLVLMNQCVESCARHNINYTARTNEIDRRITDVMREKEKVDGMKVDGTYKHELDSIGKRPDILIFYKNFTIYPDVLFNFHNCVKNGDNKFQKTGILSVTVVV